MAKKKDRLPPFVALPWELLNSRAYINLPPSASKALPYFLGKVRRTWNDPERYSEKFTFSYPEGEKLGFAGGTFARVIDDLVRHGFIILVEKGGLRGKGKGYSKFRLSKGWRDPKSEDRAPQEHRPTEGNMKSSDMAIYRVPSKNGNNNGAEKAPTTPKMEIDPALRPSKIQEMGLCVSKNEVTLKMDVTRLKKPVQESKISRRTVQEPRLKPKIDITICRICGEEMLYTKRDPKDEKEHPFNHDRICGHCMGGMSDET